MITVELQKVFSIEVELKRPSGDTEAVFEPIDLIAENGQIYDEIDSPPSGGQFTIQNLPLIVQGIADANGLQIDESLLIQVLGLINYTLQNQPGVGSVIVIEAQGTYRNKAIGATFTANIENGQTFTAPSIIVTDVDGTGRQVAPNENITCEWTQLILGNADGIILNNALYQVNNFPLNGLIKMPSYRLNNNGVFQVGVMPTAEVDLKGDFIELVNVEKASQEMTNIFLEVQQVDYIQAQSWADIEAAMTAAQIDAAKASVCVPCPEPSGIAYQQIRPVTSQVDALANGLDCVSLFQSGAYDAVKPANPAHVACLDPTDQEGTTLLENNFFGNKYAFTDTAGNPSSVGTSVPDRVNFKNHDWSGAIPNCVIAHEFGIMIWNAYLQNGARFNMRNDATGDTFYNWLLHISQFNGGGFNDWLPLLGDTRFPHARHADNGQAVYNNFFVAERSDNRCGFMTGESVSSNHYYPLRDSGNLNLITAGSGGDGSAKSGESGFTAGITLVFPIRMLTQADIDSFTS